MSQGSKMVVLGALVAVNAGLLTETIGYSHNTMAAHADWVPGKLLLGAWVMGAEPTVFRRNLLHRNQLQLHAWFGYQKVYHAEPLSLGALEIDFSVADKGYLVVEYARTEDEVYGVRLSRNPTFESVHFRSDAAGTFIDKTALAVPLEGDEEHTAYLALKDGRVTLHIDGQRAFEGPVPSGASHILALRGGRHPVSVHDVRATDASGRTVIAEDFSFPVDVRLVLACLGMIAGLALLPLLWARLRRRPAGDAMLASAALQFMLTFAVSGYFAIDYYLWSANYFVEGITPDGLIYGGRRVELEKKRRKFFARYAFPFLHPAKPDYRPVAQRLGYDSEVDPWNRAEAHRAQVARPGAQHELVEFDDLLGYFEANPLAAGTHRIVLIGGSQTAGSGARRLSDRLAFRIHDALQDQVPGPVALVNVARNGAVVDHLQKRYAKVSALGFELAIVNVGNNDALEGFEDRLRALLEEVRASTPKTLLVLEPTSIDEASPPDRIGGRDHLAKKHEIMRRMGAELHMPVLDLDGTVNAPDRVDAGFLWWDFVHMTSLGQRQAGELIAGAAAEMLVSTSTSSEAAPGSAETP